MGGATGGGGRGGSTSIRDAGADTYAATDALPPGTDARLGADSLTPCVAQIRSIVPARAPSERIDLTAGENTQLVLRAEIVVGGPENPVWDWQASIKKDDSSALVAVSAAAYGQEDPAAVAFPITSAGVYTFKATARSSLCSATVNASVASPCPACDQSVSIHAAPPPTTQIPVQEYSYGLAGSHPPFSQINVVLSRGDLVWVEPSLGSEKVTAYVRINEHDGELVADGLAEPKAGFGARLRAMNQSREMIRYSVLVVPFDGVAGGSVAATAPQLFPSMTSPQIDDSPFALSGGVTVTGTTTSSSGLPVTDARVILSNRDPNAPEQPTDLIFSSVGRADAQGSYTLHAQPGPYWVSISPPSESGLPEVLAPEAIDLSGDTEISFQWKAQAMASLTLIVNDDIGAPLDGARVRLTSAKATEVGTLTYTTGGMTASDEAEGNVRVEGTTSQGMVTFANLPAGTTYDVLIIPAILGPSAATTSHSVTLPASGATYTVQATAQRWIFGVLLPGRDVAPNWAKVHLVVYDRSVDTPEPPQTLGVGVDGTYAIGVSPGRRYVVVAVPDVGSGLARTFVGPGALQASEFPITQRMQTSMPWRAAVLDELGNGIANTALQVFCKESWPYCVDPTVPLAESTSGAGGAFELALPDPSSR